MAHAFKLDHEQLNSTAWMSIKSHIQGRISDLRISNDANLDLVATSNVRGRIAELKKLLEIGETSLQEKIGQSEA